MIRALAAETNPKSVISVDVHNAGWGPVGRVKQDLMELYFHAGERDELTNPPSVSIYWFIRRELLDIEDNINFDHIYFITNTN